MKQKLTLIILLFIGYSSTGQINVGSKEKIRSKPGKIEKSDLEILKNSITHFSLRTNDKKIIEQFAEEIKKVWTISEIFVYGSGKSVETNNNDTSDNLNDSSSEIKAKDINKKKSYFSVYYSTFKTSPSSGSYNQGSITHRLLRVYLTLHMEIDNEDKTFCRIELDPTSETYDVILNKLNYGGHSDFFDFFYKKAEYRNWEPGFLKNSLQYVNNQLLKNEEIGLYESITSPLVKNVKNDTLYLPHYIFYKTGKFSGNEGNLHDVEKLLADYTYPYKILKSEELSKMILESEEPKYYLMYVKSGKNKFIYIMNSKTGEMLYRTHSKSSNINSKDFGKITKAMK